MAIWVVRDRYYSVLEWTKMGLGDRRDTKGENLVGNQGTPSAKLKHHQDDLATLILTVAAKARKH